MTRRFESIAFALFSACAPGLAQTAPAVPQKGESSAEKLCGKLESREGHHVLTLWGSPRERGYAHGYLLAREIVFAVNTDLAGFLKRAGFQAKRYEQQVLRVLVPAFRWSEAETTELRAMLEGVRARLSKEDRHIDFLDREIRLDDLKAINTAGDWLALGCSTIALRGNGSSDGAPVVARNFDFHGFRSLLDHQVVLRSRARKEHKAFIGVTHPGGIGVITTMNEDGVFVSIHDVHVPPRGLAELMRPNVPRLVALRRLAEKLEAKRALAQAHELLRSWPTLYGNNVMVVTPKRRGAYAAVIEYDGREKLDDGTSVRSVETKGASDGRWIACTNHYRKRGVSDPYGCSRYAKLQKWAKTHDGDTAFDVVSLFALADEASMSGRRQVQKSLALGTLHQAVAFTGTRQLHLKLGRVGKNVAGQKPVTFDVRALVEESGGEDR